MKHNEQRYGYCDEIAAIVDMNKTTIEGGEEMTTNDVVERLNQLEAELATLTNSLEMTWGVILQRNPSVGGHISYAAERGFQKLEARLASARAIMQKFVDKVDRGEARSTVTYTEMKQWMEEE